METYGNLADFFKKNLEQLKCDETTKAYIVGLLSRAPQGEFNLAGRSITVSFANAKENYDFFAFQRLADYLFFTNAIFGQYLEANNTQYNEDIGRMSYYNCYRILKKQWIIYEDLADNFGNLTQMTAEIISIVNK